MPSPDVKLLRLDSCPEPFRAPLRACARGDLPANVALLRLAMAAENPDEVEKALLAACQAEDTVLDGTAGARLKGALALWRENPQVFAIIKAVLQGVEHEEVSSSVDEGVSRWATAFDRLAEISPEGGVALYALGNPDLLSIATSEVVERLRDWRLIGHDKSVLDLGCGIGRFVEALAPEVSRVEGVDVSAAMVERARLRCSHLQNAIVHLSSGRDLSLFAAGSFDLVLAVDVFPYLVQSGLPLVKRYLQESARVLRPGGSLLVLNFSYRGDVEQDRADLDRLAAQAGLRLSRHGTQDFAFWDASTFQLTK